MKLCVQTQRRVTLIGQMFTEPPLCVTLCYQALGV